MSGTFLDQIFLRAKEWLLSPLAGAPDWLIQIVSSLINISGVLGVFLTLFALISVLERKILGRMQNRYGPNRVGPFGLFQPVADGIKMLIKEDIVPARADKIVHFLAPILIAATAMRAIAQMISYELPLIITVLPVVMVVGSLAPDRLVAAQGGYIFGIVPHR